MTNPNTKPSSNPTDIGAFYDLLAHQGVGLTEIRLLHPRDKRDVLTAFVNSKKHFIEICERFNAEYQVYAGLAPRPMTLCKAANLNRIIKGGKGAKDADIEYLTVFALDADPKRDADTGTTTSEVKAALAVCEQISTWFELRGFRKPALIASGNGGQLIASVPVTPLTPELAAQTKAFEAETKKFGTDAVKIDTISNPSRILRVPGTLNIKGDGSADRPHRLSRLLTPLVRNEDAKLLAAIQAIPPTMCTKDAATPINLKGGVPELGAWTKALIESDDRLNDLFNGVGKTEGDTSPSGYHMTLAIALATRDVPPEQIAAVLLGCPDGRARKKGRRYVERTVARALAIVAEEKESDADADDDDSADASTVPTNGTTGDTDVVVSKVVIYDTVPPTFEMHIGGKVIKLSSDDLLKPGRFTRAYVDHLHRIPRLPPKKRWNRFINRLLAGATIVHQPDEASPELFLRGEIARIVENLPLGSTREDLEHGKSITMNGCQVFTLRTLRQIVHESVQPTCVRELAVQLRALACKPFKPTLGGKQIRVWATPPSTGTGTNAAASPTATPANAQESDATPVTPVASVDPVTSGTSSAPTTPVAPTSPEVPGDAEGSRHYPLPNPEENHA